LANLVIKAQSHQILHNSSVLDTLIDAFTVRVIIPIPDSPQTGLAADSTGVKWTTAFKCKWKKGNISAVRIRASWTSSAGDSTIKIAIKDITNAADVVSVSGNSGTNQEAETTDLTNITDGGLFEVYAEVTAASGTAGATFDISYIVVEIDYKISS